MRRRDVLLRLITRDPASGRELIVTRLECPESGVAIEGAFSLGWIGALSPDQLEFVGVLLRNRGNVQRAAADLGMSYNTGRSRMDDIVRALGGQAEDESAGLDRPERAGAADRSSILDRLAAGEIDYEEAMRRLQS